MPSIHPGDVVHTMDHHVMELRDSETGSQAYLTVYSLAYMPEVGTGHCAFLRVRTQDHSGDVDLAFAETPGIGSAMQRRLQAILASDEVSLRTGIDLDRPPQPASFQREAGRDTYGYRIVGAEHEVTASWLQPEPPLFVSAPRGSLHRERDIVATMIPCWDARLAVDGARIAGRPFADDFWKQHLGRPFSSAHLALGETAIATAG